MSFGIFQSLCLRVAFRVKSQSKLGAGGRSLEAVRARTQCRVNA